MKFLLAIPLILATLPAMGQTTNCTPGIGGGYNCFTTGPNGGTSTTTITPTFDGGFQTHTNQLIPRNNGVTPLTQPRPTTRNGYQTHGLGTNLITNPNQLR